MDDYHFLATHHLVLYEPICVLFVFNAMIFLQPRERNTNADLGKIRVVILF